MGTENSCAECTKPAKQCCSACKLIHYCSKECQKKNWKIHKERCKPFAEKTHPVYGRYLVASRNIKAGELFLKEPPIVVGPKQISSPTCLGCSKKLQEQYKCPSCGYSLCSKYCATKPLHKLECLTLSKGSKTVDGTALNEFLTPVRCHLLKTQNTKQYKVIMNLQSHLEDIKGSAIYRRNQDSIVNVMKNIFGWTSEESNELHELCGILITNAFEINQDIRGLYNLSSLFAHNCKPNIKHAFDEDFNILWRTTTSVLKGEPLFTTYSQILWNTLQRQLHLKSAKFFLCTCTRCSDPTELGTDLSTLLCVECGGRMMSENSTDINSQWTCITCSHSVSAKQVNWGDQSLYKELKDIGKRSPNELETFLTRYAKALHPNHRFFVEAKYALIRYYGNYAAGRYVDLTQQQLEQKVKWCHELLQLSDLLDPGMSLLRGNILMELQAGIVALAKYLISNELITQEKANEQMSQAVKHLQEASEILRHEPHLDKGGLDDRLSWLATELEL